MYSGMDPNEYNCKKSGEKFLQGLKAKAKSKDDKLINSSKLRAERIKRKNELMKQDGYLRIPDGIGEKEYRYQLQDSTIKCIKNYIKNDDLSDGETHDEDVLNLNQDNILNHKRRCYVCKQGFTKMHFFYDSLCSSCASLNWMKRNHLVDLPFGCTAILTGGRVKIGFHVGLKLLRSGATLIVTSRFPAECVKQYERQEDFNLWRERLHVYGLDFRSPKLVETWCQHIAENFPFIDIIINNACQTIRRPVAAYKSLVDEEMRLLRLGFTAEEYSILSNHVGFMSEQYQRYQTIGTSVSGTCATIDSSNIAKDVYENASMTNPVRHQSEVVSENNFMSIADCISMSSLMSQIHLTEEDNLNKEQEMKLFPKNIVDASGQPLDLRRSNSWLLKLGDIPTSEFSEVMTINVMAPFIINNHLLPCLKRSAAKRNRAFVINVSAMEGKFYRYKTANHPHTNMAKSSINMMTRTCAEELSTKYNIYMNSVDTGWINDENPIVKATKNAEINNFQTPIDEIDAASRVVDPIFQCFPSSKRGLGVYSATNSTGCDGSVHPDNEYSTRNISPPFGKFFKDYFESEW